jgi:hypothetical protein
MLSEGGATDCQDSGATLNELGAGGYSRRVTTIVDLIRDRHVDAELAALLWLLAEGRVPIHVASPATTLVADAVRGLADDPALVTDGPGATIEDVLRQPVPLRPATGAIVILDADGRISSAHLLRPPLRDGAGHVRPQGPAVLAARVEADDRLEHFAWGVLPELAEALGRKAGDLEGDIGERATFLDGLVAASATDPTAVADALRHWPHLKQRAN